MALLEILGMVGFEFVCDVTDLIEDKVDDIKSAAENRAQKRAQEEQRQIEVKREPVVKSQYSDESQYTKRERRERKRVVEAVPKKPVYNTNIKYRCSICGGNRKLDLPKGEVICPYCDFVEKLEIIKYEDDYQAMDLALKEYEEKKRLDAEKERLQAIERQKEVEAENSNDMLEYIFGFGLFFFEAYLLMVELGTKNNMWPFILFNSIAISCYIIYKKGLIKTVLMYTVFLPFVILVWIFDKYLNMKQIGIAVGAVITLLVDILVVILLIELIGGGI